MEASTGNYEWQRIIKKDLLAIVSEEGKIIYPRDKYDENVMNYGRVRLRNGNEAEIYQQRKNRNKQAQIRHKKINNNTNALFRFE